MPTAQTMLCSIFWNKRICCSSSRRIPAGTLQPIAPARRCRLSPYVFGLEGFVAHPIANIAKNFNSLFMWAEFFIPTFSYKKSVSLRSRHPQLKVLVNPWKRTEKQLTPLGYIYDWYHIHSQRRTFPALLPTFQFTRFSAGISPTLPLSCRAVIL